MKKKHSLFLLLPAVAMICAGCNGKKDPGTNAGGNTDSGQTDDDHGGGEQQTVAVTGVSLNKNAATIEVGKTETLVATVAPENATNKNVTWESSAPAVATVANGVVTAIAPGNAVIKVKTEDGNKEATCAVTVEAAQEEVVHVQSIKKDVSAYVVEVGQTATIKAKFTPENATDKGLIYTTSVEGVVSIAEDGTVTGLKEGVVDITVTSHDNPEAAFKIEGFKVVLPSIELPASTANGYTKVESGELNDGDYVQFIVESGGHVYAMPTYSEGNNIKPKELAIAGETINDAENNGLFIVVKNADNTYSFMDENQKYLDASGGSKSNYLKVSDTIKGSSKFNVIITEGKAKIVCADASVTHGVLYFNVSSTIFSCYVDKNGDAGYPLVSIYSKAPETTPVTGIELDKEAYKVDVGHTVTATAKVTPFTATDKDITYTLTNVLPEGCMTIENNVITAAAVGTAKVVATSHDGGFTATADVTAVETNYGTQAKPLSVTEALTIISDQCAANGDVTRQEIWCVGEVSDKGTNKTSYYQNVKVSDGSSEVLVYSLNFDNDLISEHDAGKTIVFHGFAKKYGETLEFATNGTTYVTATYVGDPIKAVTGVTLDKTTLALETNSAPVQLVATIAPEDAYNDVKNWSSSNEAVATVADGLVTPIGVGEATIKVVTQDGNHEAECVVTVSPATKTLTGITVSGPDKTTYTEGEFIDLTGLVVTAHFDDQSEETIEAGYTANIAADHALELTDTSLVISYQGKSAEAITLVVNEKQPIVAAGNYTIHHTKGDVTYYVSAEVGAKNQPLATTDAAKAVAFDFILKEGTLDTYVIKVHDENQYLAIGANDNNGVRFSSSEFEWTITEGTRDNGSFDLAGNVSGTIRYLTLYETTDFRSYNSSTHDNRHENTDLSTVAVKNIDHIEIKQEPTKKQYYVGEAFDPSGLIITAHYTDGSSEDITEGFEYEGKTGFTAVAESRTVKITYKTKTVYVQGISVIEDQREQTGIEFAEGCDMTKKEYKENESWDATGLAVKDVYSNGDKEDAEGVTYTFNPAKPAEGVTSVTVTATKEGFDPVNKVITGITVEALPKNVDEISAATFTGLTTSYGVYSSNDTVASDASYEAYAYKGSTDGVANIQMRSSDGYFISKGSNRYVRKISVEFQKAGAIGVYARNQEFTGKADANASYLIGTIDGTTTELTITGDNLNFMLVPQASINIKKITVTYDEQKLSSFIDAVTLNKESLDINVGETETLTATVNGFGENYEQVNWTSSNTEVLTVDGGVLTPVAASDTPVTITATSVLDGTKSATCQVTVKAARSFTELTTTGGFKTAYTTDDEEFEIDDLVVVANYSDDSTVVVTDYTVTWSDEFDNTVGSHSSTPTIHWDGHDQELAAVSYEVTEKAELTSTTYEFAGMEDMTANLPSGWATNGEAFGTAPKALVFKAANKYLEADNLFSAKSSVQITIKSVANSSTAKDNVLTVYGLNSNNEQIENCSDTIAPVCASVSNLNAAKTNATEQTVTLTGEGITGIKIVLTTKNCNVVIVSVTVAY